MNDMNATAIQATVGPSHMRSLANQVADITERLQQIAYRLGGKADEVFGQQPTRVAEDAPAADPTTSLGELQAQLDHLRAAADTLETEATRFKDL